MTGKSLLTLVILVCYPTFPIMAQDESNQHPLKNDPTGIQWVFSLDEAIQKARKTNRIIVLKPVNYRTKADSDQLSPSSETQRAVSFVDSRVVNLLNRRFVSYYFNMDPVGTEYDQSATALAMDLYPDMRYETSMPTPPLLFMTPERKFLGLANNFLTGPELLNKLVEILDENSEYLALTDDEELAVDPVEKARTFYELRQLDMALETLNQQHTSEAYFLRVLIAREKEDWKMMKDSIDMVTDAQRLFDIDVENLLRYWQFRNLDGIKAKGDRIGKDNPRFQEAMYYLGLAYFHTHDSEKAIEIWTNAIQSDLDSAWALRLDLVQGLVKLNPARYLSEQDVIPSMLGRKYMCPNGIEDLTRRK